MYLNNNRSIKWKMEKGKLEYKKKVIMKKIY